MIASSIGSTTTSAWTELVDSSGQVYWWNNETQQSSWDKPEEIKSDYEKAETTLWHEYTDDNGRKYYHNEETTETTWTQPEEYRRFLERLEKRKRDAEEANLTPLERMLRTVFASEPAKNAFALLLAERHMTSSWTWEQAVSATFEDDRSKVLKMAERKQVYQLLVTKLKALESDERRLRERKLVADFQSMLDSWADFDRYTSFKDVSEQFTNDQRLISITTEAQRLRIFNEYKANKERMEREKVAMELEKKIKKFKLFIAECRPSSGTLWTEFLEMHGKEANDFDLEPLDRLKAYMEHMNAVLRKEEDDRVIERRSARSLASRAREAFQSLLNEHLSSYPLEWHKFQPTILSDPRYLTMLEVAGSTPAELYYDFLSSLEDNYLSDKRKVKNLVRTVGVRVLLPNFFKPSTASSSHSILSSTIETIPKLDFAEWSQKVRTHLNGLEDSVLLRIYNEFGNRELGKLKRRLNRTVRNIVEALRREAATSGELPTLASALSVINSIEGSALLTESEKQHALEEAILLRPQVPISSSSDVSEGPKQATRHLNYDTDSEDLSSDEEHHSRSRTLQHSGSDLVASPRKTPKLFEDSTPSNDYHKLDLHL